MKKRNKAAEYNRADKLTCYSIKEPEQISYIRCSVSQRSEGMLLIYTQWGTLSGPTVAV